MLNPLKWKYEDRVGLLIACAFGAVIGIALGYWPGHEWFNIFWAFIGAVVVGAAVYP